MFKQLALMILLLSCSTVTAPDKTIIEAQKSSTQSVTKEFSNGELILATELLTKIFDEEMAPLECVSDTEEAGLFLRTIRPRMEVVQDDLEAMLDAPQEIDKLIKSCDQNCTCSYIDELFREHQVVLSSRQKKTMALKKTDKEVSRCLNFVRETFCQSELKKILDKEKQDFSFEE